MRWFQKIFTGSFSRDELRSVATLTAGAALLVGIAVFFGGGGVLHAPAPITIAPFPQVIPPSSLTAGVFCSAFGYCNSGDYGETVTSAISVSNPTPPLGSYVTANASFTYSSNVSGWWGECGIYMWGGEYGAGPGQTGTGGDPTNICTGYGYVWDYNADWDEYDWIWECNAWNTTTTGDVYLGFLYSPTCGQPQYCPGVYSGTYSSGPLNRATTYTYQNQCGGVVQGTQAISYAYATVSASCPNGQGTAGACTSCNAGYVLSGGNCIVLVAPTVTLSPSSQSITSGQSASFTYTLGGGVPTSISYKMDGGSPVAVAGGAFSALGLAVGSHNVIITAANASGSDSSTASVTVTSPPVDICTDISGNQVTVPTGCQTPVPSPGTCIPLGYTYNGSQCVVTPPSISSFKATPTRVRKGSASSLSWTVTNPPASCTISSLPAITGFPATITTFPSGTLGTGAINYETIFTIVCGSAPPSSATVTIYPSFQEI